MRVPIQIRGCCVQFRLRGTIEAIEDTGKVFFRDADAVVGDAYHDRIAAGLAAEMDDASGGRVPACIVEERAENSLDYLGIAENPHAQRNRNRVQRLARSRSAAGVHSSPYFWSSRPRLMGDSSGWLRRTRSVPW